MKRTALLLSALLLIVFSVRAQNIPKEKSLLWRIEGKGNAGPSYLFGTVHLVCKDDFNFSPRAKKALNSCAQVCFEMNLAEPGMTESVALQLLDLSGKTLRDYFRNEQDYLLVRRFIEDSLKQSAELFDHMKPVALYLLYSTTTAQGPCQNPVSYEGELLEMAQSNGKTIAGLETIGEQVSMLDKIPVDSVIARMVRVAKGNAEEDKYDFEQMMKAYRSRDLRALNELLYATANAGDEKLMNELLGSRNEKWIAPMQDQMRQQATFFAVGAGHLWGLIGLLRKAGFTVVAEQE